MSMMRLGLNANRRVSTRYALPNSDTQVINTWTPIPELLRPDADVSVLFLAANDILFHAPVVDPWFAAGSQGAFNANSHLGNMEVYLNDEPARALACVQQYQFCNPALKQNTGCTPLLGIYETFAAGSLLFSQPRDRDRFLWSASAISNLAGGFTELLRTLGSGALLAKDSLSASLQWNLPSNQWELELEHWFKFTLADVQRAVLDQATGPVLVDARQFHSPPVSPEGRTICSNQKIRSDSYTSFNVLGLILIFSIGSLIMILSALLPYVTGRLQQRQKPFAGLEWICNDTLQLQRLAHEAIGAGNWEGACDDYPRTRKGDLLGVLDITDQKHPVLRAPNPTERLNENESKEEVTQDSAEVSLLSLEIPRSSLDLPRRFTTAGI